MGVATPKLHQPVRWDLAALMHHQAQVALEVGLVAEVEVSVEASVIADSAIPGEALAFRAGMDSVDKLRQMLPRVQEAVVPAGIEEVMADLIGILEGQLVATMNR